MRAVKDGLAAPLEWVEKSEGFWPGFWQVLESQLVEERSFIEPLLGLRPGGLALAWVGSDSSA